MNERRRAEPRGKTIRGKGWKRSLNVSLDKYNLISGALMNALSSRPLRFGVLVEKVKKDLTNFPGSVEWYAVGALRQLEREGKVVRAKGRTVTYRKT